MQGFPRRKIDEEVEGNISAVGNSGFGAYRCFSVRKRENWSQQLWVFARIRSP
jgi:hypothetical protein